VHTKITYTIRGTIIAGIILSTSPQRVVFLNKRPWLRNAIFFSATGKASNEGKTMLKEVNQARSLDEILGIENKNNIIFEISIAHNCNGGGYGHKED